METRRWLGSPLALLIPCCVLGALTLPWLWHAVIDWDCHLQLSLIDGHVVRVPFIYRDGGAHGLSQAFTAAGANPWLVDQGAYHNFFRPVAAVLLVALHEIGGRSAPLFFTVALLLLCGLAFTMRALLARLIPAGLAILAVSIYLLDDIHSEPLTFTFGAMYTTPAAILSLLGTIFHIRWRQGWRPGLYIAIGLWLASLATSETGLCGLAFVLAYEIAYARDAVRQRMRSVVPAAVIAVIYVGFYKAGGYGSFGQTSHIDPVGEPGAFVALIAENIPVIFRMAILGRLEPPLWVALAIFFAVLPFFIAGFRAQSPETRRGIATVLLGGFLAIVPMLPSKILMSPEWARDNIQIVFSIALAVFWALSLAQAVRWLKDPGPIAVRLVGALGALALVFNVYVWSPYTHVRGVRQTAEFTTAWHDLMIDMLDEGLKVCDGNRNVVWLRAAARADIGYAHLGEIFERRGEPIVPQLFLAEVGPPFTLSRTGERSFQMTTERGATEPKWDAPAGPRERDRIDAVMMFSPVADSGLHSTTNTKSLALGEQVVAVGATIRVLAVEKTVSSIEVTFQDDLAKRCFITLARDGRIAKVALPPVGGTLSL